MRSSPPAKGPASTLFTAEQIHSFIRRARAELCAVDEAFDGVSDENEELVEALLERREAAQVTLVFCAEAAGFTRDPSLLPFLASLLGRDENEDEDEDGPDYDRSAYQRYRDRDRSFDLSVRRILAVAPPDMNHMAKLARSDDITVRLEVAKRLPVDDETGVHLLQTLATTDGWDVVRQAARDRLAAVREIAWWQGKFSRDPLSGLSPADAQRLRAPLETITQVLDLSAWDRAKRIPELADAIAQLPDSTALDVLHTMLSNVDEARAIDPVLLAQLVSRDRDGSELVRLIEQWSDGVARHYGFSDQMAKAAPLVEVTARRTVALRLFDEARRRSDCDHTDPLAVRAAMVMAALWPAQDDPTPVLSALLAQRERSENDSNDGLARAYWDLLARKDVDVTPLFERLAEAHLADYPPPWDGVPGWWSTLLDRAATATQLQELAARVLAEKTDPSDLAWALRRQIGPAEDAATDPERVEILRRAWAEPRLRSAILFSHELIRCTLPIARDELRAGRLTHAEAVDVMLVIDSLWGGIAPLHYSSRITPEWDAKHRHSQLHKHEALLGPESFRGPPTEAEWAAYRKLRDQTLPSAVDRGGWFDMVRMLPEGDWTASDRAWVQHAMQAIRTEHHDLGDTLAAILRTHPEPAWLPLMDELAGIDPDRGNTIRVWRDRMREALDGQAFPQGPDAPANPIPPASCTTPPVEWMDEPDDEP